MHDENVMVARRAALAALMGGAALAPSLALGANNVGSLKPVNNLLDLNDIPTARLNTAVPTYVTDRTSLAALDPTKDTVAFLKEDGREGWFEWNSANLSGQVTADPQQGVYVPPASAPSGASGAWVRVILTSSVWVTWFGATGDGTTDDTAAVHAAITFGKTYSKAVYFPDGGTYRVTSGYTNSQSVSYVTLFGSSRLGAAAIKLDSTDSARFFYDFTGGSTHYLTVYGLNFISAQFVQDSDFFRFTSSTYNNLRMKDVIFTNCDRCVVYKVGTYSDTNEYIGVAFNSSGTIYSDSNSGSRGNLLTLIDVSHNGTMPATTAKQVMNLQGFRGIQATNLLLQGGLPSSGWTVLYLDNDFSADWTQDCVFEANGYWSEWTTNAPTYQLEQKGGRSSWTNARFEAAALSSGTVRKIGLSQIAKMTINDSPFIGGTGETINQIFEFADTSSHVYFHHCAMRAVDKSSIYMTFDDCSFAPDGAASSVALAAARFGTAQAAVAARWRGGYLPSDGITIGLSGGTTSTPSTDATYGRKYLIIPNVNTLDTYLSIPVKNISVGQQYSIIVLCKLPTFTGGTVLIQPYEDAVAVSGGSSFDTTYSASVVAININTLNANATSTISIRMRTVTGAGVAGNLEIYAIGFYLGDQSPRAEYPSFPTNVTTNSTAAPTAGAWAQGDVVWNSAAASGGPAGWMCTAAGSPGTWKAMANLA